MMVIQYTIPDKNTFYLVKPKQSSFQVFNSMQTPTTFSTLQSEMKVCRHTRRTKMECLSQTTNNYESHNDHTTKCNSCFTLLSNCYLMRIFLHLPSDDNTDVCSMLPDYIITNVDTKRSISGKVEMSNTNAYVD